METFFEYETVMIPLSNGKEQEFAIMEEFDLDDKHYIVVSPVMNDEIQEGFYIRKMERWQWRMRVQQKF